MSQYSSEKQSLYMQMLLLRYMIQQVDAKNKASFIWRPLNYYIDNDALVSVKIDATEINVRKKEAHIWSLQEINNFL